MSAVVCDILLKSRYQEPLGSNVTETELDWESGELAGAEAEKIAGKYSLW